MHEVDRKSLTQLFWLAIVALLFTSCTSKSKKFDAGRQELYEDLMAEQGRYQMSVPYKVGQEQHLIVLDTKKGFLWQYELESVEGQAALAERFGSRQGKSKLYDYLLSRSKLSLIGFNDLRVDAVVFSQIWAQASNPHFFENFQDTTADKKGEKLLEGIKERILKELK